MSRQLRRQLAAILFADIAGYTALMGADEDRAFRAIYHFKSITQPLVEQHNGQWHKDLGDGALCSFVSALEAVQCAIEVQQRLNKEADYKVRIGIHLGDATFQNGDVFGDGVNIAARIQGAAAEGGICVSEGVHNSIRNKEGIKVKYLGKKALKNVEKPVGLYQLVAEGVENKISSKRFKTPWGLLALTSFVFLVIGGILGNKFSTTSGTVKLERFHLTLPPDAPMAFVGDAPFGAGQTSIALSPDGNHAVYAAQKNNHTQLYLRSLDDFEAHPIKGTEGAYHPFFSPDGQGVGFFSGTQLKKVSITNGSPETLCEVTNALGAVWTSDNRIIFANNEGADLYQISSFGGIAEKIEIQGLTGNVQHLMDPFLLPGEKHLLVFSNWPREIKVISLEDGKQTVVLQDGASPKYIQTGHLVYEMHGKLRVVPFDINRLSISGNPITLIDDIRTEGGSWDMGQFDISKDGTLIYAQGISAKLGQLFLRDFEGTEEDLPIRAGYWGQYNVGYKKNIIALSNMDTWAIHIFNLDTGVETAIRSETPYYNAVLSLDDQNVIFSDIGIKQDLFVADVKGIYLPKKLFREYKGNKRWPVAISSDGTVLQYCEADPDTKSDIKFHFLNNNGEDFMLFPNKGDEQMGNFSPSGEYFAYVSDEGGRSEIYVQAFPMKGNRTKVSNDGGNSPVWSPTEDKLYYLNGNAMMAVSVQYENDISFGLPKLLFDRPLNNVPGRAFDLMPDGKRFVLLRPLSEKTTAPQLKVIKHWFEEVKGVTK